MKKELLKFLIKAERLHKEAEKLNIYHYENGDKKGHMLVGCFIKCFDDYTIEKRGSSKYPYELVAEVEDYEICALLDEKEYKKLQKELQDDN